jgi:hypothetical protein
LEVVMSICPRCANTGYETYDATNERGHLITAARRCTCTRPRPFRDMLWLMVGILALLAGITPACVEGLKP